MSIKPLRLIVVAFTCLKTIPMHADTFISYPIPASTYKTGTTDYGGGNGSGSSLNSLGAFSFSSGLSELIVPNGWATWNGPPAVEKANPDVLESSSSTLKITLGAGINTAGFELEPNLFEIEPVAVSFFDGVRLIDTLTLEVDGDAGAKLFALTDTTPGASISSIMISDGASDTFALAQLRAGEVAVATTPEPSSIVLLGTGLLGAVAVMRRRLCC